jgi:5-methylcytosine-specific restriction endonuclease McrA
MSVIAILLLIWLAYAVFVIVTGTIRDLPKIKHKKYAKNKWTKEIEPKNRKDVNYPEDWERRRAIVFQRANGKCEICGTECGRLLCDANDIWLEDLDKKLVTGGHVHHIVPVTAGGDHSINNLRLLCLRCHYEQHPGNKSLKESWLRKVANDMYFGRHPSFKIARKEWNCRLCNKSIKQGDEYYGGDWSKICLECYNKYKSPFKLI